MNLVQLHNGSRFCWRNQICLERCTQQPNKIFKFSSPLKQHWNPFCRHKFFTAPTSAHTPSLFFIASKKPRPREVDSWCNWTVYSIHIFWWCSYTCGSRNSPHILTPYVLGMLTLWGFVCCILAFKLERSETGCCKTSSTPSLNLVDIVGYSEKFLTPTINLEDWKWVPRNFPNTHFPTFDLNCKNWVFKLILKHLLCELLYQGQTVNLWAPTLWP